MKRIIEKTTKDKFLFTVFILYVVLVFIGIAHHEPWADEAHSWLMSRDSSLFDLVTKDLRYIGHPVLWYLVLFIPSRVFPYTFLGFISLVCSSLGIFYLIFYVDLPKLLKVILPFSYFLFYQYAVVSRGYVLLPILFLSLAKIYEHRVKKINLYILLLSLLSLTTIHGMLVAIALIILYWIDLIGRGFSKNILKRNFKQTLVFFAVVLFIVYQLWPPKDLTFASSYNLNFSNLIVKSTIILITTFSGSIALSSLFLLFSVLWFKVHRSLSLFLLPIVFVLIFFSVKYYNDWHQGIVFLIWLFAFVVSLKRKPLKSDAKLVKFIKPVFYFTIAFVMINQVYWSLSSYRLDFLLQYSAGESAAGYLKNLNIKNKKIYAVGYWSSSVLPYFDWNIFQNEGDKKRSYWLWSPKDDTDISLKDIISKNPDVIVVSRPKDGECETNGYYVAKKFEGYLVWKNSIKERNDIALCFKKS